MIIAIVQCAKGRAGGLMIEKDEKKLWVELWRLVLFSKALANTENNQGRDLG